MVLNEVIPQVPFPHNLARRFSSRPDLDERVRQEIVADQVFLAPCGDGFRRGLLVPDHEEEIAVGHLRHVMMEELLIIKKLEVPDELAVPGVFLNPAQSARAAAEGTVCAAEIGGPEQM